MTTRRPARCRNALRRLIRAGGGAALVCAAGAATASAQDTHVIPGPGGPTLYRFDADAEGRVTALRIDRGSVHRPTADRDAEVIITGRVVLRARHPDRAAAALAFRGLRAEPIEGLEGTLIADAGSPRRAIALANALTKSAAALTLDYAHPEIAQPVGPRVPGDFGLSLQWNLINTLPGEEQTDLNVEPVWDAGITGAGVTVGVIDQGVELTHPDLLVNIDPNPAHSEPDTGTDDHATSVAGLIAMGADNNFNLGGVGVSYNARLTNHTYGDPTVSAASILRANHVNDIKNNSWGPADLGRIFYPPQVMIDAIEQATRSGRDGLGTILVWAGGNGALRNDRVQYDPYAGSRFTLAIGAYDDTDTRAIYSEPGTALLAVAPSSGGSKAIFTTTVNSGWTQSFGFTSAAAPQGAGVVALMLEANPNLTWRDVQHIIADTSRRLDPTNPSWQRNSAGTWSSDDYGFGALDAHAAVTAAQSWISVAPEASATSGVVTVDQPLPNADAQGLTRTADINADITIESVELILNAPGDYVGDLDIFLTSPTGTVSTLALARQDGTDGYIDWVFTSLRHWDEPARGTWTVRIADKSTLFSAEWTDFEVRVHGTASGPAPCDAADLAEPFGVRTFGDVSAFLTAFNASDPVADFAAPFGTLDLADVVAFIDAFDAGCP